jgi:hypothetical protein
MDVCCPKPPSLGNPEKIPDSRIFLPCHSPYKPPSLVNPGKIPDSRIFLPGHSPYKPPCFSKNCHSLPLCATLGRRPDRRADHPICRPIRPKIPQTLPPHSRRTLLPIPAEMLEGKHPQKKSFGMGVDRIPRGQYINDEMCRPCRRYAVRNQGGTGKVWWGVVVVGCDTWRPVSRILPAVFASIPTPPSFPQHQTP